MTGRSSTGSPRTGNRDTVYSVSEITRRIKDALTHDFSSVWIKGEISNLRRQTSGHQYFTIKDHSCQLSCVLFASRGAQNNSLLPELQDGLEVQLFGNISVYEPRGQYQLIVEFAQLRGEGALQARFEALKRKLHAEGLFDPAHKRPLPKFPRRVAVITSPSGAAWRDFLQVLDRRARWLPVLLAPALVQGDAAANAVADAFEILNALALEGELIDVIVVCRGGGSLEDLWAFNEEIVARAIFASRIPVVSAIGHEIDFTISDLTADVRAPTPSAAAEIIAPDAAELQNQLEDRRSRLTRRMFEALNQERQRLDWITGRSAVFRNPWAAIEARGEKISAYKEQLTRALDDHLDLARNHLEQHRRSLRAVRPEGMLVGAHRDLARLRENIRTATRRALAALREHVTQRASLLRVLGPQATLDRGFTMTLTEEGEVLTSAGKVAAGQNLITRFRDGEIRVKVDTKNQEDASGGAS